MHLKNQFSHFISILAFLLLAQPAHAELIWYTNLDQNTGTTVTPNVGAQTCTFTNSPTWTTGKFNFGIDFDASTSDYLNCGTSHITSTNDWAIAAWIKLEASGSYRAIVISGDDDATALSGGNTHITNSDKLRCIATVGTNSVATATSVASIDETGAVWTHVGCKKVGTAVTAWINGSQDGSATASSATMDYTADAVVFRIGSFATVGSGAFLGQIDEVRIYDADIDMAVVYALDPRSRRPIPPIYLQ